MTHQSFKDNLSISKKTSGWEPLKSSGPPAGLGSIGNQMVRSAVEAINGRDRERWFELFSEKTAFSDDGINTDFTSWCDRELFGSVIAYIVSIDKVEEGGLTFFASYHSDRWGDFKTFWRFKTGGGKFSKLDVGATNY